MCTVRDIDMLIIISGAVQPLSVQESAMGALENDAGYLCCGQFVRLVFSPCPYGSSVQQ